MKRSAALVSLLFSMALPALAQTTPAAPGVDVLQSWNTIALPAPPRLQPASFNPATAALLLLDLDAANCANAQAGCQQALPRVKQLLDEARARQMLVVHALPFAADSVAWAELKALPGEVVLHGGANKFLATDLQARLQQRGVRDLVVSGASAGGAVLYTSVHAAMSNFRVLLPVDALGAAPGAEAYARTMPLWHLKNTSPQVTQRVLLTRSDLLAWREDVVAPGAATTPAAASSASASVAASAAAPVVPAGPEPVRPSLPATRAVSLDASTTALLVIDMYARTCNTAERPRCVPAIARAQRLLEAARAANMTVIYTGSPPTAAATSAVVPELAPQTGEVTVRGAANKFLGSDLEKLLAAKGIHTVVCVGTSAEAAVLYTGSHAALLGLDVVVPVDGIASVNPASEQFAVWQMQGGDMQVARRVTLTRVESVTFR